MITNTRGDVIETRNGDGNVNAKFTYDAWGELISVTDGAGNALPETSFAYQISLKYRGYVYDWETGLYYLQSRYYDPNTGRFINADAVDYIGYSGEVLSYNLFAYCENNAVIYSDYSGSFNIGALCFNIKNILFNFFNKNLAKHLKSEYKKSAFGVPPVEVKVSGNKITISITFNFSGSLENKRYQDKAYNKTYKKLFLEGVEQFWSGNFTVFEYSVTLKTKVKESNNSGIAVQMIDGYGLADTSWYGVWSIGNYGRIRVYKDSNSVSAFKYIAAHEVGHILGVNDIYILRNMLRALHQYLIGLVLGYRI